MICPLFAMRPTRDLCKDTCITDMCAWWDDYHEMCAVLALAQGVPA